MIERLLRLVGRWARKPVNHTSWVAVVTPTDRPKSVRNRCLIELFVALFVLSLCPFDISVGVGAFVIGLSQISSFFSGYGCIKRDKTDNIVLILMKFYTLVVKILFKHKINKVLYFFGQKSGFWTIKVVSFRMNCFSQKWETVMLGNILWKL